MKARYFKAFSKSKIPPPYSPKTNCQPKNIEMTIPSTMTKFVEANKNAIEDTKLAPFLKEISLLISLSLKLSRLEFHQFFEDQREFWLVVFHRVNALLASATLLLFPC